MGFRKYTILMLFLIIALAVFPVAFLWVWQTHYMVVTLVSIVIGWMAAIVLLFFQVSKIQLELKRFLMTFQYDDTTVRFTKKNEDSGFIGLYNEFDRIIAMFSQLKISKERELLFFKLAEENSGIGLLAFSADGNVRLINTAFTELFGVRKVKSIEQFNEVDRDIYQVITGSKPGHEMLKIIINNQLKHIAIRTVSFGYEKEQFLLMAFQDIKNEIDQTELDAWQKLIRILRHEIHNSLIPITFLSSGLIRKMEDEIQHTGNITAGTSQDLLEGLNVIRNRSIGLSGFVENYKRLTDLPLPNMQPVEIGSFLTRISSLFKDELTGKNIRMQVYQSSNNGILRMDEKLIEQVMINLISNAIEALEGIPDPSIRIDYREDDRSCSISVTDNGKGIPADIRELIFTPFFTTRQNGTGIGLSISRQIMRLHNGFLLVNPQPESGTVFTMTF